jgi:hypothetical protein
VAEDPSHPGRLARTSATSSFLPVDDDKEVPQPSPHNLQRLRSAIFIEPE